MAIYFPINLFSSSIKNLINQLNGKGAIKLIILARDFFIAEVGFCFLVFFLFLLKIVFKFQ